ncbi:MAG: lysozyme family protein [Lachnospiraceae bacterium]|nr:lysozyme family protein [Lachnospiraceae bacterium]
MDRKKVVYSLDKEARDKFFSLSKKEKASIFRKTEYYAFTEHRKLRAKYISQHGYKKYKEVAKDRDFIEEHAIIILGNILTGKKPKSNIKTIDGEDAALVKFVKLPYIWIGVVVIALIFVLKGTVFSKQGKKPSGKQTKVVTSDKKNKKKKRKRKKAKLKTVKVYKSDVSDSTKSYRAIMEKHCNIYNIGEYIEVIMAITEQESGGQGIDVMQSSESGYGQNNPVLTAEESINAGIHLFSVCLDIAECKSPKDIERLKLALQGYNYGYGYIRWANLHYGGFSENNAAIFSAEMKAKLNTSVYGDPEYVYHVLRYYKTQKVKIRETSEKKK